MVVAPHASSWGKQISSTVIPDILPGVSFFTLFAAVVTIACDKTGYKMAVNTVMLTIIGTMISFVISLRTSTANDRYNEGRRAWSNISLASRTFAFNIWVYAPPTTLTVEQLAGISEEQMEVERAKGLLEKRTMLNLVHAFAVATKHYSRNEGGVYHEDLYHLISGLPRYGFPSSAATFDQDRTNILGLWRTPHPLDGKVKLPASRSARRRGTFATTVSSATSISMSEGLTGDTMGKDLEMGDPICESIQLAPAYNPPPITLYDRFPPLTMFKPLLRLISRNEKHLTTGQRRALRAKRGEPETNIPLQISLFLSSYLSTVFKRGTLAAPLYGPLLAPLTMLQDSTTTLERVITTPLPFAYQAHLRLSVYIYLIFLPFQTYALLGYLSIVSSFLASVIFLGFIEIGAAIENPVGYDDSDLDIDGYCSLIGQELSEIAMHPAQHEPESYVFSDDNRPFPGDPRTANEILAETIEKARRGSHARPTWHLHQAFANHHSELGARAFTKKNHKKDTASTLQSIDVYSS